MSTRLIPKRLFTTSSSSFSSSTTPIPIPILSKPTPSKSHLHTPIPPSQFPKGFILNATHAGIKKNPLIPDLTVILSTSHNPTSAAACFTRNAFKAAPVLVSDQILKQNGGRARAVVVNSGCANAVTGKQGLQDAWAMVKATDTLLPKPTCSFSNPNNNHLDEIPTHETLVMSTGVIGQNLPISKILTAIHSFSTPNSLSSTFESWERAAKGFMTTDTFPKLRARSFTVQGRQFNMAGMDKGAGMIHPDMGPASTTTFHSPARPLHATLLGCIMTDAPVSPQSLQNALTYAVDRSFNSISVDGDMSTNDSIILLANGAALSKGDTWMIDEEGSRDEREGYKIFRDELTQFAADLAKLVVRDGEGATKFVTVTVKGAPTYRDAHSIASRISTSALVKTALYGEDANWGRILAATGSVPLKPSNADGSTPTLIPSRVSVTFHPSDGSSPLAVLVNGEPENVDERRAKAILGMEDFEIVVELGMGGEGGEGGKRGGGEKGQEGQEGRKEEEEIGEARYWTCDFSYEYVRINGDYRS